jgi:hypothetical protein
VCCKGESPIVEVDRVRIELWFFMGALTRRIATPSTLPQARCVTSSAVGL